jgi:hypothetical protein
MSSTTYWWLTGGTVVFLIVAVVIALIFVVRAQPSPNGGDNNGPAIFAGILLVLCVFTILGVFIAYFNGYFNKFRTTPQRMSIKYDYLTHYQPVQIIKGLTPATEKDTSITQFQNITPDFKVVLRDAAILLSNNKSRVEIALGNVQLTRDTKVLSDYDFSVSCVKLAQFMKNNDSILKANEQAAMRVVLDVLSSISGDATRFNFVVSTGDNDIQTINILTVFGLYLIFIDKYPAIADYCINNNKCPYKP